MKLIKISDTVELVSTSEGFDIILSWEEIDYNAPEEGAHRECVRIDLEDAISSKMIPEEEEKELKRFFSKFEKYLNWALDCVKKEWTDV